MNQIIEVEATEIIKGQPTQKKDIPKYFDKEHIHELLSKIENHEERMLVQTLWMSGLRVTEVISFKKRDIDFKNKIITVRWLKSRKYNERKVPIHSALVQMLAIYTGNMNLDDVVFPITRQRAWQITKKTCNTNPHTFRHSFAVNYLREGGNIVNLFRILGHSKIQTTMEYLRIVPTDLSKELETIGF